MENIEKLKQEMEDSSSYTLAEEDLTEEAWKKVKKLVNRMFKEEAITKEMKQYLTFVHPNAESLKGNPKLHKTGAPFRTIISAISTPRRNWQKLQSSNYTNMSRIHPDINGILQTLRRS